MKQLLLGGYGDSPAVAATNYHSLTTGLIWNAAEVYTIAPTAATLSRLRVMPVGGNYNTDGDDGFTFTLMVNGNPSTLTVTLTNAETDEQDTTHEVSIAKGDKLSLRSENVSTPTGRITWFSILCDTDDDYTSWICGGVENDAASATDVEYSGAQGQITWSTVEAGRRQVIPTDGLLTGLSVYMEDDPGVDNTVTYTVRIDGVDTALAVTFDSGEQGTVLHDTASIDVTPGQVITISSTPFSTPTDMPEYSSWGIAFAADVAGESVLMSGTADDMNPAAAEYYPLGCRGLQNWTTVRSGVSHMFGDACDLYDLYVLLLTAPDNGADTQSYQFEVEDDTVDTLLSVTIEEAATTGNNVANTVSIAAGSWVTMQQTPANTPVASDGYWGMVMFIETPPVAGGSIVVNTVENVAAVNTVANIAAVNTVAVS